MMQLKQSEYTFVEMASMKYRFGQKIRDVRERRGMTMKEVAEKADLSESLISQIERNKVSPAIDTLLSIVEILDIDLEHLFSDFRRERAVQIVHPENRKRILFPGVSYEQLVNSGPSDGNHGIEAYFLQIDSGHERGNKDYGHPGRELGIIVEGSGEFEIGTRIHSFKEGDSLSFDSDLPHIIRNTGSRTLKAYWIVTPPKEDFGEA